MWCQHIFTIVVYMPTHIYYTPIMNSSLQELYHSLLSRFVLTSRLVARVDGVQDPPKVDLLDPKSGLSDSSEPTQNPLNPYITQF